jgi:hypothetical protein
MMLERMFRLFPRNIGKGVISEVLHEDIMDLCNELVNNPHAIDMSQSLAGSLKQQLAIPSSCSVWGELNRVFKDACVEWIEESKQDWTLMPQRYWSTGTYSVKVDEIWLNVQEANDYNPVHVHSQDFSGVLYLKVPDQVLNRQGGNINFHGPDDFNPGKFQMGMKTSFTPVERDFYVFPALQQHSVDPFKGDGERWSIAFNAIATPAS